MRVFVPVLLIAVLGLIFLLYVWTDRRRTVRQKELREARTQAATAILALEEMEQEVRLQLLAHHSDLPYLHELVLQEQRKVQEVTNRKELT